jgi:hypothetical protein
VREVGRLDGVEGGEELLPRVEPLLEDRERCGVDADSAYSSATNPP